MADSRPRSAVPFTLLYHLLPDVARAETRSLLLPGPDGVPRDGVAFMEMFCDERACDCRRALFRVAPSHDPNRVLATISYGWEPDSFYREWAGYPLDDDDLDELRGPSLMRLAPQSDRADEMLELCRELLRDDAYRERVIRHYALFRAIVDGAAAKPSRKKPYARWVSPSRSRRKRK